LSKHTGCTANQAQERYRANKANCGPKLKLTLNAGSKRGGSRKAGRGTDDYEQLQEIKKKQKRLKKKIKN